MVREKIKYRGRGLKTDRWFYGYFVKSYKKNKNGDCFIVDSDGRYHNVRCDTIGEFIGRKDANGKEIYEGDEVRVEDVKKEGIVRYNEVYCEWYVEFEDGLTLDFGMVALMNYKVKVLGNIYEETGGIEK